jgi:nitrous oxide reductase accessory protein NosL
MKKTIYLILIAVFTLTSCKKEATAEEKALAAQIETYDALMTEAMEVHDEIMPKMGELMELKGELLANQPESISQESYMEEVSIAAENLKASHDGMMTWMKDYSEKFPYGDPSPETKEAIDEKMPVLEKEVEEIKQLRDQTMKSIDNAKALLKK